MATDDGKDRRALGNAQARRRSRLRGICSHKPMLLPICSLTGIKFMAAKPGIRRANSEGAVALAMQTTASHGG